MNPNKPELAANQSFIEQPEESNSNSANMSPSATSPEIPSFGWSAYAERINGRFAMIGLTAVIFIEALTSQTFLSWAGLIN